MEIINLTALIESGSLKNCDTETEFHAYSSVYQSDEFVMKVPNEKDFAHWDEVKLSVGDYLDRLPPSARRDYESLKEAFGTSAACYTVWKCFEKRWTYEHLLATYQQPCCGIPPTDFIACTQGGRLAPLVRQKRLSGPTLKAMIAKSHSKLPWWKLLLGVAPFTYTLKTDYVPYRETVCEALWCYIDNGNPLPAWGSYKTWIESRFPLKGGAAGVVSQATMIDFNPTNFIFQAEQRILYYVDLDAEGVLSDASNQQNVRAIERMLKTMVRKNV